MYSVKQLFFARIYIFLDELDLKETVVPLYILFPEKNNGFN